MVATKDQELAAKDEALANEKAKVQKLLETIRENMVM